MQTKKSNDGLVVLPKTDSKESPHASSTVRPYASSSVRPYVSKRERPYTSKRGRPYASRKDDDDTVTKKERDEIVAGVVGRDYVLRGSTSRGTPPTEKSLSALVETLVAEYSPKLVEEVIAEVLSKRNNYQLSEAEAKIMEMEKTIADAYRKVKTMDSLDLNKEQGIYMTDHFSLLTGYGYCRYTTTYFRLRYNGRKLRINVYHKYHTGWRDKKDKLFEITAAESEHGKVDILIYKNRLFRRRYSFKELIADYVKDRSGFKVMKKYSHCQLKARARICAVEKLNLAVYLMANEATQLVKELR
ncbi:MAG: hypothetical protein ABIG89_00955 [Candidatus Woesearchaeota archaeon]